MNHRPKQLRFPILLCALLFLPCGGVPAREYPLFQPKNSQNMIYDYGPVSDQMSKGGSSAGGSAARVRMVDTPEEKFPFVRVEFEVQSKSGFAGVTFNLNDVRIVESDIQSAILMRMRVSDPNLRMILKLKDDRGREASVDLAKFIGRGNKPWKYYEVPLNEFDVGGQKLRSFISSLTLVVQGPSKGSIDIALIGINAP